MIKRYLTYALFILLFSLQAVTASAQETKLPQFSGYVNDFAGILGQGTEAAISSVAQQLDAKTSAQLAVVTVDTVKPLTIEQYAVELFEKWGIGQKDKDNGLLILIAVNDKKIRIETGYGLEGALPDAICSQIIYQDIVPEFKKGNFEKGVLSGTVSVASLIAKEYNVDINLDGRTLQSYPRTGTVSPKSSVAKSLFYLILFIMMFGLRSGLLFYFILGPRGRRRGGYWYGTGLGGTSGGFSGGFGGFGGGFSGGGGASGGW